MVLALSLRVAAGAAADEEPPPKEEEMALTSSAFVHGEPIPTKYTGEGEDVSPPLAWDALATWTFPPPEDRPSPDDRAAALDNAKEFALICDDPDAPTPEPWIHWVLYKIPGIARALAEGDNGGGVDGLNGWGETGYRGPMPPPGHGVHRYFFKLYALDEVLTLGPGASKTDLLAAMEGHVIAHAELLGTYERK